MRSFGPAEQSRVDAFQQFKEKGGRVLKRPRVIRALGSIAQDLLAVWDGAFLPKVRNGVVSLPREQRFTNNFALLPLMAGERNGELLLDPSMFEPTLRRLGAFKLAGGTSVELARKTSEAASRWGVSAKLLQEKKPAETFAGGFISPDTFFTTRPLIFFAAEVTKKSTLLVGRIGIHEAVHGIRFENDTEQELMAVGRDVTLRQSRVADEEFVAYNSGAVILREAGRDPGSSDLIDFRVESLSGLRETNHAAFVDRMVALGAVPTLAQLASQS